MIGSKNYQKVLKKAGKGIGLPKAQDTPLEEKKISDYLPDTPSPPVIPDKPDFKTYEDPMPSHELSHKILPPLVPETPIAPDVERNPNRSGFGKFMTRIGNVFRPEWRDLDVNIKGQLENPGMPSNTTLQTDWRNQSKNILNVPNNPINPFNPPVDPYNPFTNMPPINPHGPAPNWRRKSGGTVGSSNYQQALKSARKGGSR